MFKIRADKSCGSLYLTCILDPKRVKIRPFWPNSKIGMIYKSPLNCACIGNNRKNSFAYCSHNFRVYLGKISDDTSKNKFTIKVVPN